MTTDHFGAWMAEILEAAGRGEHVDSEHCWCVPKLTYTDPVSGSQVWVYQYPERLELKALIKKSDLVYLDTQYDSSAAELPTIICRSVSEAMGWEAKP